MAISAGKRVLRFPLTSLKHWRLRRELSQRDLALKSGTLAGSSVEDRVGPAGRNPSVAQHLVARESKRPTNSTRSLINPNLTLDPFSFARRRRAREGRGDQCQVCAK